MQNNNRTPLHRAIEKRSSSIVYYFVKECNVNISMLDEVYKHILMYAASLYMCIPGSGEAVQLHAPVLARSLLVAQTCN